MTENLHYPESIRMFRVDSDCDLRIGGPLRLWLVEANHQEWTRSLNLLRDGLRSVLNSLMDSICGSLTRSLSPQIHTQSLDGRVELYYACCNFDDGVTV